jgi:hypothetical protein
MKLFVTMVALLLGGLLVTSLLGNLLQYRADTPHPVDLRYSPRQELPISQLERRRLTWAMQQA